jgi:site-specific recombinase XerD
MRQEISGFLGYAGSERGFSPKTIDAYRHDLGKFSEFAEEEIGKSWEWGDVDQYTIKSYLQSLADRGNAAVSRGRKLATLKSFFKYLTSQFCPQVEERVSKERF